MARKVKMDIAIIVTSIVALALYVTTGFFLLIADYVLRPLNRVAIVMLDKNSKGEEW